MSIKELKMKVWAATRNENHILTDVVIETDTIKEGTIEQWNVVIGEACRELDLARPVVLKKHRNELNSFRHTAFAEDDFMESVDFKKFTIEIFPEKK